MVSICLHFYVPATFYWTRLNGLHADDYEIFPPSKRTVQLSDDMREEVAQFVVANRNPELPAITVFEAMRYEADNSLLGVPQREIPETDQLC